VGVWEYPGEQVWEECQDVVVLLLVWCLGVLVYKSNLKSKFKLHPSSYNLPRSRRISQSRKWVVRESYLHQKVAVGIVGTPISQVNRVCKSTSPSVRTDAEAVYQRQYQQAYRPRPPPVQNIQYQRPGLQLQVNNGGMLCRYFPYACQSLIPFAYAQSIPAQQGPGIQVQAQAPAQIVPPSKSHFFLIPTSHLSHEFSDSACGCTT
jgi:hypothetical protein